MGMPQLVAPAGDYESYLVDVPLQVLDAVMVHDDAESCVVECSLYSERSIELMDRLCESAISLAESLKHRMTAARTASGWSVTVRCRSTQDAMRLVRELDAELLKGDSAWRRKFSSMRDQLILLGRMGRAVSNVVSCLTDAFKAANDEQVDVVSVAPVVRALADGAKDLLPPGAWLTRIFGGAVIVLNTPTALTHAWEQWGVLLRWICKVFL